MAAQAPMSSDLKVILRCICRKIFHNAVPRTCVTVTSSRLDLQCLIDAYPTWDIGGLTCQLRLN